MKLFALAAVPLCAMLLLPPRVAADAAATSSRTVREYVKNTDAADWTLDPGWTWSGGVLTHWAGAVTGAAQQMALQPLTPGKTYRIGVLFSGRTKGSVTISLGGVTFSGYGTQNDGFGVYPVATDASAPLTFTATKDFDGSLSEIRVIELGDELVDETAWLLGEGWAQNGGTFSHAGGAATTLQRQVAIEAGRTYQVRFNVAGLTTAFEGPTSAAVTLGGATPGRFGPDGDWNYRFEMQPVAGDRLIFTPQFANGSFSQGRLREISVREITTDAAAATEHEQAAPRR